MNEIVSEGFATILMRVGIFFGVAIAITLVGIVVAKRVAPASPAVRRVIAGGFQLVGLIAGALVSIKGI